MLGMKLSIKLAFRQQFTWLNITRRPGGIAEDEWLSLKRSKYRSSRRFLFSGIYLQFTQNGGV
jgi:hypothetical protein